MNRMLNMLCLLCMVLLGACAEKAEPQQNGNTGTVIPKPEKPKIRTIYISPGGSDSNAGTSVLFPYQTFDKVLQELRPGDVVYVMPGTYETKGKPVLEMTKVHSGTENEPITIKAYDDMDRPVFVGKGKGVWNTVKISASHVVIDGLELKGMNESIDSLAAYKCAENHHLDRGGTHDWSATAEFNTNAISVDGESGKYTVTNVIVRNCVIHDFPGGGLGASNCDYITFENNLIYNNAWYTMYACSGISIINPVNSDAQTGHKLIIRGNRCFNNMTKIPWYRSDIEGFFKYSDGNGIIIDINNKTYEGGPYNARTLVYNNLSVGNGGSGIHAYSADHVDIINNTAYFNGRKYADGEYAEIYAHGDNDVNIVNNIMYARPGGHCNKAGKADSIIYENNLCYNGKVFGDPLWFKNGKTADPLFVNPSLDVMRADFHLKAGTPAIGMGVSKPYMPSVDIEGNPRGVNMVVGAYSIN